MAYEIVLPRDTQTDIDELVEHQFVGKAVQLAAVDALESELDRLALNPTLGAVVSGGPYESRRIHRFALQIDGYQSIEVEFAYRLNTHKKLITISSAHALSRR